MADRKKRLHAPIEVSIKNTERSCGGVISGSYYGDSATQLHVQGGRQEIAARLRQLADFISNTDSGRDVARAMIVVLLDEREPDGA